MVKRATCHDCGTKEGQLHILGCDMERCPFCSNQLISCQCVYKKLRTDVSPGAWAYSHGLTDAQQKDWEKLLGDKGRIPFVLYPNLCAKCGTLWPEMFLVPDAEWKHYIEPHPLDDCPVMARQRPRAATAHSFRMRFLATKYSFRANCQPGSDCRLFELGRISQEATERLAVLTCLCP